MREDRTKRRGAQPVGLELDPSAVPQSDSPGASQPQLRLAGGPGPRSFLTPRTEGGSGPAWVSAGNLLAGLWLVIASFVLARETEGPGYWNDIVIGVAVALVALVRMAAPFRTAAFGMVNVILGAWLMAAPFVLAYSTAAAIWNDIIVGGAVMVLALVSVVLGRRGPSAEMETEQQEHH